MGAELSRHEGKFTAADESPIDIAELLAAMGAQSAIAARDRQKAIACFLSGGDGWRDALDILGGAFAEEPPRSKLRPGKGE